MANMLVNIVILKWYGISKGYLLKIWALSVFFAIIHQQQRTRFLHVDLFGETLFGNEYVPVQKRAGDQYQCNERDKYSNYLQCLVSKWIIIMQNDIFSIILKHKDNKVYDFIKCLS